MLIVFLVLRKFRIVKLFVEEIDVFEIFEEVVDDEEFDWEIEQIFYEEVLESVLNLQCYYGFGNLRIGVFQWLQDELNDVIDVKNLDFIFVVE